MGLVTVGYVGLGLVTVGDQAWGHWLPVKVSKKAEMFLFLQFKVLLIS